MKAAAESRLAFAIEPAVEQLIRLALHRDDPGVQLRAIKDVLDRGGLRAPKQVEFITVEANDREIARLEAELGLPPGAQIM